MKFLETWIGKHMSAPPAPTVSGETALYFNASGQLCKRTFNGAEVVVENATATILPAFRATESTGNTASAGFWTTATGFSTPSTRGSGLSMSNGVLTVATAGWYDIHAQVQFSAAGAVRYLLRVGTGTAPDSNIVLQAETTGNGGSSPALNANSGPILLSANTALRMFIYCSSNSATTDKVFSITAI